VRDLDVALATTKAHEPATCALTVAVHDSLCSRRQAREQPQCSPCGARISREPRQWVRQIVAVVVSAGDSTREVVFTRTRRPERARQVGEIAGRKGLVNRGGKHP
jgi:hypothetical protein